MNLNAHLTYDKIQHNWRGTHRTIGGHGPEEHRRSLFLCNPNLRLHPNGDASVHSFSRTHWVYMKQRNDWIDPKLGFSQQGDRSLCLACHEPTHTAQHVTLSTCLMKPSLHVPSTKKH